MWWTLYPESKVDLEFGDHNQDADFKLGLAMGSGNMIRPVDPYVRLRYREYGPLRVPGPWESFDLDQDENFCYARFKRLDNGEIKVEVYRRVCPTLGTWALSEEGE